MEVTPLAELPPAALQGTLTFITGANDWAAIVEVAEGRVTVVPLDGSPVVGPFEGTLALVNP